MSWLVQSLILTLLAANLGDCIIWPHKISNELEVQVLDVEAMMSSSTTSTTERPIDPNEKLLLPLLRAGEFVTLESATRQVQERFEKGALSDIQLRNIYRQFYDLDDQDFAKIEKWKNTVPDSYAAHLVRGVYFKRKGQDARGD
jgi:hypothetical protein